MVEMPPRVCVGQDGRWRLAGKRQNWDTETFWRRILSLDTCWGLGLGGLRSVDRLRVWTWPMEVSLLPNLYFWWSFPVTATGLVLPWAEWRRGPNMEASGCALPGRGCLRDFPVGPEELRRVLFSVIGLAAW